jgi:hypothetical protein
VLFYAQKVFILQRRQVYRPWRISIQRGIARFIRVFERFENSDEAVVRLLFEGKIFRRIGENKKGGNSYEGSSEDNDVSLVPPGAVDKRGDGNPSLEAGGADGDFL